MRIGLDIGGTKIAAALVDDAGTVVAQSWHEHSARGISAVADALVRTVRALPEAPSPLAVGVSVSGLVARDGIVTGGASLELRGDLAAEMRPLLPHPVRVFNDAEATFRSVREDWSAQTGETVQDAVLLTIGTGIGGALVVDGHPVRGASGLAGELGHVPVMPPSDRLCVCGSSGCLEQYAGGKGIADQARLLIEQGTASDGLAALGRDGDGEVTAKDVVAAARRGDASSRELLDQAARCCAQALRAICVTVEPTLVLLGGSVAHGASDLLPARIRQHLHAHWPFAGLTAPPPVHLDAIGPYAAAIGAAKLAAE
ncbi:MAG: ROK family protein [Microbacterium sp.]